MSKYILSLSYGKDSLACLGAIEKLGWQLDGIIHAEVWATDTIPADLPPMVEFKKKADQIIKDRWGIEVQHVCAMSGGGVKKHTKVCSTIADKKENILERSMDSLLLQVDGADISKSPHKRSFEEIFYRQRKRGKRKGMITGFPMVNGSWCNSELKMAALNFWESPKVRWCII